MTTAHSRIRLWWQPPPRAAAEAAGIFVALIAGLALLALLPYDDIFRYLLCFKFYAGFGCAS